MKKYFLICTLLSFSIVKSFSQGGGLTGPLQVCPGISNNYSYSDDQYIYTTTIWTAPGSTNITGSGANRSITWGSGGGTINITLKNGTTVVTTLSYTVTTYDVGSISNSINGTTSTTFSVCPSTSFTLTQYASNGSSFTWQKSPKGLNSWTTISTQGSGGSITQSITADTDYRISGQCSGSYTYATALVSTVTTPGTIAGTTTICTGSIPAAFTSPANATGGNITYQWQSRPSGGSWADISGAIYSTYAPGAISATTDFQRRATGCVGPVVYSNAITVTTDLTSVGGTTALDHSDVYENVNSSVSMSVNSSRGTIVNWNYRYSDNGGFSYTADLSTPNPINLTTIGINRLYQMYATVKNGTCPPAYSNFASAMIYTSNVGTVTPATTQGYGSVSGTLTISNLIGDVQRWEYSDNNGTTWINDNVPNFVYNFTNVTTNRLYRARILNGTYYYTATVSVVVYPSPVINSTLQAIALGKTTTLTVNNSYYSYQWMKEGAAISGATSASYIASEPGNYQVQVKANAGAPATVSSTSLILSLSAQTDTTANSIVTTIIRKKGVTPSTNLYTALQAGDYMQRVTYLDGLGRPIQSIGIGLSPLKKDIVQAHEYDTASLESTVYLPFVANNNDGLRKVNALKGGNGNYNTSDQYLFYQGTSRVAQSTAPYAKTLYENSPLTRAKEQGAPGTDWQLGGHTAKQEFHVNTVADGVMQWTTSGPGAIYPANTLLVSKTIDENGNSVVTYTDKLGRTVLKRVQADVTIESVSVPWLETYYVYDTRGNMAMQVPPKATAKIKSGTAWTTNFRDEWCFVYVYDVRNRLVEKKTPDATAWTYFCYDPLGRLVLTQDGNLRTQNKWAFIKYDMQGRAVMTGLYTNTTNITRATVQTNVVDLLYSNVNDPYYEKRGSAIQGYTNQSFPTANVPSSAIEVFNVNYYDNYDLDNNGTADYSYTPQGIAGEGTQGNSYGLPTASKKLILGTANWLCSYQFYDVQGRVIQVRGNNHLSLAIDNLNTVVYDFEGKVLFSKTYHNAGGNKQVTTLQRTDYDAAGRPLRIYQKIDNAAKYQLVAKYDYNELGQLVKKNLHCTTCREDIDPAVGQPNTVHADDIVRASYSASESVLIGKNSIRLTSGYGVSGGATFNGRIGLSQAEYNAQFEVAGNYLQNVDYRYNIRGWITSINNAQLTNDGVTNEDTNDYFGLELLYNTLETGLGNTTYYNGNISAVKWKGTGVASGTADQRSYKYTYDKTDKLTAATFQAFGLTTWDKEVNTLNEWQSYDHNGNILTLVRNQNNRGLSGATVTSSPQTIDNLSYTYAFGNQLIKVEDAVATAIGTGDFKNGAVNDPAEYTYNSDGSLLKDKNKTIAAIVYNVLGKPQQVTFDDGRSVSYTYSAAGTKLKTVTLVSGKTTTTDYVGGFVYTNDTLRFFNSPEGRIVKNGNAYEYQYVISDHQGNSRVLFSSAPAATQSVTATFEIGAQATEATNFKNYPSMSGINSVSANNSTPGGTYSQYLNAGYASMVGVAKSYKIFPGDKVQIEANARYNAPTATSGGLPNFANALLSAFSLPTPAGGEAGTASSAINTWGGIEAGGNANGTPANGLPKAFVNIIIFDKNYKLLDVAYKQVTSSGAPANISASYTAKEAGYAFVYVSNEHPTQTDVYFDDVKMSYTPGNVIQYNEYYPFGLQTANSWTRDKAVGNNFLANGGTELNTTTALYDLEYRTYDPALGRMYQVDPMSGKYSSLTTYNYAFNNPVSFNDPNGADPEEAAQFKAQKALGSPSGVSNSFDNLYRGNSMFSMFDTGWRPGIGSMAATISQWNPNFGGPMYLGQGYNGAIYGLPTEIEAAGGADEFIESKGGLDPTYGYNEKSLNRMRMEYNRTIRAPGLSFEDWLEEKQQIQGGVILDTNGNVKSWAKGANSIYVDFGDGDVRLLTDKLARTGAISPQAFSNALLNIVKDMKFPDGNTFDKNRLMNGGHIAVSLVNGVKVYTNADYQHGSGAYTLTSVQGLPEGMMSITYQGLGGNLTVDLLRSVLGYHEYYAHGIKLLTHESNDAEIKIIQQSYFNRN